MNLSNAPTKGIPLEPFVTQGGESHLSNPGQLEMLQAVISRGVLLRTTARGMSMTPFIRDEDVLTIAPMAGRTPRIGDVVAFVQPESRRLAVHRIVACLSAGWLVRGDNCPETDGVIPEESLIGYVTRIERQGRDVRLGIGPLAM